MRRSGAVAVVVALLAAAGCASRPALPPTPYLPDREDYLAFRERHPDVLDPNYLPFMVHRTPAPDGEGDWLIFCRWSAEDMPLRVSVRAPRIPDALQDEFDPKEPAEYVAAVEEALAMWEAELEGLVRFQQVEDARDAQLSLVLVPERAPAPEPDLQVLGLTPVARGCRASGYDAEADRVEVDFEIPAVKIYIADHFGLLDAEQVEWIALHEIGHALGMRGHSPIPADLMYEVVRDRVTVRELSTEDVNSFVSLYQLPNGTIFRRIPPDATPRLLPAAPPEGPPELEAAPHVDPRLGFSWRPPAGWLRIETSRGVVAVDGVSWDYTASFQIIVERYPTIEAYLERYGAHYLGRGRVLQSERLVVSGRPALWVLVDHPEGRMVEYLTFVEAGDGRVVVVLADCPAEMLAAYQPWFDAALRSLRIWGPDDSARPRR